MKMSDKQLRLSSRIPDIRITDLSRFCQILDMDDAWKDLVAVLTDRTGQLMFEHDQIMAIERSCQHSGSPTRVTLMNWSTCNPNLADLMDKLLEIGHYRAADFINSKVLGRNEPIRKPSRLPGGAEAGVPNVDIQVPIQNTQQDNRERQYDNKYMYEHNVNFEPHTPTENERAHPSDHKPDSETLVKSRPVDSVIDQETKNNDETEEIPPTNVAEPTHLLREETCTKTKPVKGIHRFSVEFLEQSTGGFDTIPVQKGGHLLGEGGFGKVYKGNSEGYPMMAVKCFNREIIEEAKALAKRQFETEVDVLASCCHENILRLIGYCMEQEWCIVYEFMPNGSLEERLACEDNTPVLAVPLRLSIAREVAHGLHYLHNFNPQLIHRDIKSANILLDKDFTAKIGDCGTVRLGPNNSRKTHTKTSNVIGTQAYMSSEFLENGEVSPKLDAYSYGVVLLEIITALPAFDDNREDRLLVTHVQETLDDDDENIYDLADKKVTWRGSLVMDIFQMSKKFLAHKKRRKTVSEMLSEIDMWTDDPTNSNC